MAIYKIQRMYAFQADAWEGMKNDNTPDGEARRKGYQRKYAKEINEYEAAKKAGKQYTGGKKKSSSGSWEENFKKKWQQAWDDVNDMWEADKKAKWAADDAAWEETMKRKASEAESRAANSKKIASRNKKIKMAIGGTIGAGIVGGAAYRMYKNRQSAFSEKESNSEILADAGIQAGLAAGAYGVGKHTYHRGKDDYYRKHRFDVMDEIARDHNVRIDPDSTKLKEIGRKYKPSFYDTNPNASKRVAAAEKEFEERIWKPWMESKKKAKRGLGIAAAGGGLLIGSAIAKDHFRDSRKKKK